MRFYLFLCLLSLCLFFISSCGLDTLNLMVEDGISPSSIPTVESTFETMTFSFSTKKLEDPNSFGHYYIYYKIYNSSTVLESEVNSLSNLSTDSVKKYTSAQSMLNATYNYQPLQKKITNSDSNDSVSAIEIDNASHEIKIRLTTYDESIEDYSAGIWIDNVKKGIPVRVVRSNPFDFAKDSDFIPLQDDGDTKGFVETHSESDEGYYYIALFGYFTTLDQGFSTVDSPIHFLGNVKIDSRSEIN